MKGKIDPMQTEMKSNPVSVKNTKAASRKTKRALNTKQSKTKQTKTVKILTLLNRPSGATIDQLCKATGWQAHSIRGFMSGTVRRKLGLTINAETNDKGIRRYWIESTPDKSEV